MSPERLAQLEEHFRRPSSASCNTEWALELINEVKRLSGAPMLVDVAKMALADADLKPGHVVAVGSAFEPTFGFPVAPEDSKPTPPMPSAPTPPASPHAKKKAAK